MSDTPLFQINRIFQNRFIGLSDHAPWLKCVSDMDLTIGNDYKVRFTFNGPKGALLLDKCEATDLKTGRTRQLTNPCTTDKVDLPVWKANSDHSFFTRGFLYDPQKGLIVTEQGTSQGLFEGKSESGMIRSIACLVNKNGTTRGLFFYFLDNHLYMVTDEEGGFYFNDVTMDGVPVHFLNGTNLTAGSEYFNPAKQKASLSSQSKFSLIQSKNNVNS